jgi:mono/diheme cytochrome c family protein
MLGFDAFGRDLAMLTRPVVALAVLAFFGGSAPAWAQDTPGQTLFEQRCASCHLTPDPATRAPAMEQLRAMEPEAVHAAITKGSMATMALGLSPAELRQIAEYSTGRALSAAPAPGDAASMPNRCAPNRWAIPLPARAGTGGVWTSRTRGFNPPTPPG